MLISYIQSIMVIILEVICCKIFFESFAERDQKIIIEIIVLF